MDIWHIVIALAIGALAGWAAGFLSKGSGFGLLGNIIVGILGAVVGSFVFSLLKIDINGYLGAFITATAGALLLLTVIYFVTKKR